MIGRMLLGLAATLGLAAPALAAPVTDCPNRDVPFSIQSPMIDLMLSPAAAAVVGKYTGGKPSGPLPPNIAGTTTPSFLAILTLREAGAFSGMTPAQLAAADAELRTLPVTEADRVARCVRYDNNVPKFTLTRGKVHLLVFEKINGFKDVPSVEAAHAALLAMATRKGWEIVFTESGGAFNARTLGQFDAVVWNNISGDVLTMSQRKAFQTWLNKGGGFVGMHGTAGDPVYFWDWYADTLIGARFAGHPMSPQFQEARIIVGTDHPLAAAAGLPREWRMTDEWYSFRTSPRAAGAKVVLSLDEGSYSRKGRFGESLDMGADHPLAWTNCIGRGRMFYSAIGHMPETYVQPQHVALLEAAIGWAATDRKACPARR